MALDPRSPFSSHHPLAGKIAAGVKTTANVARRAGSSHPSMVMQDMPVITLADRAQQMFSMQDRKGTRVYYALSGVFNTVDEGGKSINFIKGLYKTTNRSLMGFLQQFVEGNHIGYLELQEDPSDAETERTISDQYQRSQGSITGNAESLQPNQSEPKRREEPTADTNRSGAGGESSPNPEQPISRAAVGSQSGNRDDIPEQGSPKQPTVKVSALDLLRKGK